MSEPAEKKPPTEASDAEIDMVLAEFNGDPRAAIRSLLHDLTQVIRNSDAVVSHGFVRGGLLSIHLPAASKKTLS